jgi:uncharacterized protein YkwD
MSLRVGVTPSPGAYTQARILLLALLLGPGHAQGALPSTVATLPAHYLEERFLQLTNDARARNGVSPVRASAVLAQAARHHAEEMVRLRYVSHVSPTPGRRDVADRVALVGGTMRAVAENLAAVPAGGLDLPERVIDGWMQSPGHRQNLLEERWTHVGFGAQEAPDGRLVVVQVFAFDPNPLVFANVTRSGTSSVALRFEVTSAASGWVGVSRVGSPASVVAITAGETVTLVLEAVDATGPSHVRLGWTPDRSGGLIGQEDGWYDPATGMWTIGYRSAAAVARVLRYASRPPAPDLLLQLAFEGAARDIRVLVDGRPADTAVTGTNVLVNLPGRDGVQHVQMGIPDGGGQMTVAHGVRLVVQGERVTLTGAE